MSLVVAEAAEAYFAEISDGPADTRARWRRAADSLISTLIDQSVGTGGHVVAIRPHAKPSAIWIELGPLTRREAPDVLRAVRKDLRELTIAEFEAKYRLRHEPALPWPLSDYDH